MTSLTKKNIDHTTLLKLLHYNPDTGIWTWLVSRGNNGAKAGNRAGFITSRGYWHVCVDSKTYRSSRLAHFYMTGQWPTEEIDHKNRIKTDDRWKNLVPATRSENCINRGYWGKKGLPKHVTTRHNKFAASVRRQKKCHYIGLFETADEAHIAALAFIERFDA